MNKSRQDFLEFTLKPFCILILDIIILVAIVVAYQTNSAAFMAARLSKAKSAPALCETGNPPIGTVCPGGAIWAGIYSSSRYMITPGGCTYDSGGTSSSYSTTDFSATCSGSTDSTEKTWKTGTGVDVAGVENVAAIATASTVKGNINTKAMVLLYKTAEGGIHPAARYCDKLVYGGYDDWYLPAKTEMSYMICKSKTSITATYPEDDPNCATLGLGSGSNVLTGFLATTANYYQTSTEYSASAQHSMVSTSGHIRTVDGKSASLLVRCIRRMSFVASLASPISYVGNLTVAGLDVTYGATPESTAKTIRIKNLSGSATGVNASASSGYTITGTTCSNSAGSLANGSTCTIDVKGTSTGRYVQDGTFTGKLVLTSDDGNTKDINLTGTSTNLPDPCLGSPPIGTTCQGGSIFVGTFAGNTYMTTPSNCGFEPSGTTTSQASANFTPTCSGGDDTMTKSWNSGAGPSADIAGAENIASAATASTATGAANTTAIAAAGTYAAAKYCEYLDYGGYTDWFLPSKSELAFMFCKSRYETVVASYPQEDPDCASAGYGTLDNNILGIPTSSGNYYWSSNESSTANAWRMNYQGAHSSYAKNTALLVRCMRIR